MRRQFLLEDGTTFLNHGAFGAVLKGVSTSKMQWTAYIERQPVRFFDRELFPQLVKVSRGVSKFLCARPESILPMPSATVGINTVLRSWQRHFRPGPDHSVLSLSVAYGSTKKLLKKMSEESGFSLEEAYLNFPLQGEEDVLLALRNALRDKVFSLIVLDVIPSNAPFILPLNDAVSICREHSPGAFILADAAHSMFSLPLKLGGPGSAPVDALVTNCHKWFCGPKGSAVLYVDEKSQHWVDPLVISHGFGSDFPSGFYWPGLADWSSWLALEEALNFWDHVGVESARSYCCSLIQIAADMLTDAWGTGLGIPSDMLGPMALIAIPDLQIFSKVEAPFTYEHAEALQNILFDRGVEVPIKVLSGKLFVRISAHIYNDISEYEILRDIILELQAGKAL